MGLSFNHRTGDDHNKTLRRRNGLAIQLSALFLLVALGSLTTLAKIVTYTPIPCSSAVQYSSNTGRRAIENHRRISNVREVLAQSASRIQEEISDARLAYHEDPELILFFKFSPGIRLLRSPPII